MTREQRDSKRAAQYVRMSTDHQQYSIANQRARISTWAAERKIEIVATYEDAGRSGLTLAGRPALRKLIADVLADTKEFDCILVYDISRWGRFQDADESAHLEYLCRSAGFSVHYCAEPFPNDGSPLASLFKVLKRTLAAEYSRELSEKVRAGKTRLAAMGFHQGSVPGFALKRVVIDSNGVVKGTLGPGERKPLLTDRVVLVPGPPKDVAIVRWMFKAYADRGFSYTNLRDELNGRGIQNAGRSWTTNAVGYLLSSRKYVGDCLWGMTSVRLQTHRSNKPPCDWIKGERPIEPIVSRDLFDRVAKRRKSLAPRTYSDQELLARLKRVHSKYGRVSRNTMSSQGLCPEAYVRRFGSISAALAQIGLSPSFKVRDADWVRTQANLRADTCTALQAIVEATGGTFVWRKESSRALVNGALILAVCPCLPIASRATGQLGWRVSNISYEADLTLVQRVNEQRSHLDYFLLSPREARRSYTLREHNEDCLECFRAVSLTHLSALANQVPIDRVASTEHEAIANPYDVEHRLQRRRGEASRGHAASQIEAFLERKRRLVGTASATWSFTERLVAVALGWLRLLRVRKALKEAGLNAVPARLVEAPPEISVSDQVKNFDFGPRGPDGLCAFTRELLTGRQVSDVLVASLAKMKNARQVAAARELLSGQRFSFEEVRILLRLTPPDELVEPYGRPALLPTYERFSHEAAMLETPYRRALTNYPSEAIALAIMTAFSRRLVEDECFAGTREAAGPYRTRKLRQAVAEVTSWRNGREPRAFSRGRSM